jgi:hypothetical protein
VRFYKRSTSAAATDRILLALAEAGRVDLLEEIGSKRVEAKQAAFDAGILKVDHSKGPACDLPRIKSMSVQAQKKWLGRVFRAVCLEAQCSFLESELGPAGKDIAARWRRSRQSGGRDHV